MDGWIHRSVNIVKSVNYQPSLTRLLQRLR